MSYNQSFNPPSSYQFSKKHREPRPESIQGIRGRTAQIEYEAYQSSEWSLIHAPPNSGKTYSTFENITDDTPIVYASAREDLYEQAKRYCEKFNLEYLVLPSPHRKCPTFTGEHGKKWQNRVDMDYKNGVSGSDIHRRLDLPCKRECEYRRIWSKDFEEYDVLIAHYKHLYVYSVTNNRIVVVDEFGEGGFIETYRQPQEIISNYLGNHRELPFDSYADLVENRDDDERRRKAISWFEWQLLQDHDLSDVSRVLASSGHVHTSAARLVIGLLFARDLGNGFETTRSYIDANTAFGTTGLDGSVRETNVSNMKSLLLGDSVLVRNRENDRIHLLQPPNLSNAKTVVGLDGTPTLSMWNTAFGGSFGVERVVPRCHMDHYMKEIMNYDLVQIGSKDSKYGGVKPYSGGNIGEIDDSAFLDIEISENAKPCLISTKKAIKAYEQSGALDRTGDSKNYNRMLSSNDFEKEKVGIVSGSPHYGEYYVKKWCAFEDKSAKSNKKNGLDKSYGEAGDEILRHMREHQVLQAILRFGRDESVIEDGGATIYVNTLATPGWLKPSETIEPTTFKSKSTRMVVDCLRQNDSLTQSDLVNEVGMSKSTISRTLNRLKDDGLVELGGTNEEGTLLYEWRGSE